MIRTYQTKLKGMLALTTSYHTEKSLQKEKSLYKFIWVRKGSITLEIDHQEVILAENEVISLSNLQHLEFLSIDGEYLTVLFNSNFYCFTAMTTKCHAADSYSTVLRMSFVSCSTNRNGGRWKT